MGVFDQSARRATAVAPDYVLMRVGTLCRLTLSFNRIFDTRPVPRPGGAERTADLVIVADATETKDQSWLLVHEFQAQHDEQKPKVIQLETLTFLVYAKDTERGGAAFLPLAVFVYLKGQAPKNVVEIKTPSRHGFVGKPVVWCVAKENARSTLAKVESGEYHWGVLFWVPLMAGADKDDVIRDWLLLRDEKVPQEYRADVSFVAAQFAELVGKTKDWERAKENVMMTESAIANEMIAYGQMEMARKAVTTVIRSRFPEVLTTEVEQAIADVSTLPVLEGWLEAAASAKNGKAFLKAFRG